MPNKNTYKEVIDLDRGRFILTLNDADIEKTYIKNTDMSKEPRKFIKSFIKSLRMYINKSITYNNGITTQKYDQNNGRGRMYVSKLGLQRCPAELKAFLLNDKYYDLDISNAHFAILLGSVEEYNSTNVKHKLVCKNLVKYVTKRDEYCTKYNFNKHEALKMLYSDNIAKTKTASGYKTDNEFLIRFHRELDDIKRILISANHAGASSNDKNPYSSELSKFIETRENDILQNALSEIDKLYPFEYLIPMYDGFCVSWKNNSSQHIVDALQLINGIAPAHINWVQKDLDDGAHFDNDEIVETLNGSNLYSVMKPEYEKDRCYIKSTGAFLISYMKGGNKIWINYSENAMKLNSKPFQVIDEVTGTLVPMFDRWAKDDNKRAYDCMDFVPFAPGNESKVDKGVFNTFTEFPWEFNPVDEEDDIDLKEFLLNSIAGGDEEVSKYLYMKLAHIIQFPNENPRVATILSGEQGVGKDTCVYLIKKLIGDVSVYDTSNMEDIIPKKGSFNMGLKDKIVIEFNETQGRDGVEYIEKLKDFITRETNRIRELYTAPYDQRHIARLFILTNAHNPIPMTDGQRRFVWQKIPSSRKGDTDYWTKFYKLMNDKDWIKKIGNQLLQIKGVQEYFDAKVYPVTEVMKQYTKLNRNHAIDFIWYGLVEGEHLGIHEYKQGNRLYIPIQNLYQKYKDYRTCNFLGDVFISTQFKKEILAKEGVTGPIKITVSKPVDGKQNQKRCFVIDVDKLKDELADLYKDPDEGVEGAEPLILDDTEAMFIDELDE